MVAESYTSDSPAFQGEIAHRAMPQAARKQVTVLFCDVVDYTSRSLTLDPEDLADEIRAFQNLCGDVSAKYHGHIVNYLGDGLLVLFGHPTASEFDPQHAVRAGLEMVEQIRRNNSSAAWRGRQPMDLRVGIATGLVVVGERAGAGRDRDELIFGEAPNLAARLQGMAAPNTVVASLRTRRLAGGAFEFRDLGEHRFKGFGRAVNVWQVLHERAANRSAVALKRVTTRFVSRRAELRCLRKNYECALGGSCRIVHISGDPGIGKSRLVRAFEKMIQRRGISNRAAGRQNFHRLRITCSPYFRTSPFKPVIDETHRWLQIRADDDPQTRRDNIRQAMTAIELDGRDEHALFSELLDIPMAPGHAYLDISAGEKRRRTVDALTTFVIRLARLQPLLLVVEDLQWADPSTLEVLGGIVARAKSEKLFAVFTSRTDFAAPWPPADSLGEIKLGGLDADASARLIAAVFGAHKLPEAVRRTLIRKSGGVPLFLEETSWHLLDQLRRDAIQPGNIQAGQLRQGGVGESGGPYHSFSIPDTLQDSLNARLDQLGEARAFAQLAAVFGGEFRYSLIGKIAAANGIGADSGMDILLEADLLTVLPDKGEDRYEFRHALFQEAAYHSLLKKTRQRYHLQIAELLRKDDSGIGERHPELVAQHYTRTEHTDRAVDWWLRAGERAIAQSAVSEALQHLSQGLELAETPPEDARRNRRRLALLLNLGVALTAGSGYHGERVTRTYQQALALAETAGNARQQWTALYGLWRCLVSRAEFAESVRVSVKLKALSEKSGDRGLLMTTCGLQGMTRMVLGKFATAEHFYDKAVSLYDHRRRRPNRPAEKPAKMPPKMPPKMPMGMRLGQDPYVTIRGLGAVNKLLLGKTLESREEIERSVQAARDVGHPYTVAETLRVAAMYRQIAGDFQPLGETAEETVALSETYGFAGLLAAGNIFLAFRRAQQHRDPAQARIIRRNLQRYADNYGLLFMPYFYGVLAEASLFLGDHAAAMAEAGRALTMVDQYGEAWSRASLLCIKARAAADGGLATAREIEKWRRTGVATAEAQQALLLRNRLSAALRQSGDECSPA